MGTRVNRAHGRIYFLRKLRVRFPAGPCPPFTTDSGSAPSAGPHNVALEIQRREGVESFTYAELRQNAESVGRWLIEKGLRSGDRAAILADNHPRWVAAYFGIIAAGCTAVPLDTAFHADQVAKLLADSGSRLLFCDAKQLDTSQEAVDGLAIADCPDNGRRAHPHWIEP